MSEPSSEATVAGEAAAAAVEELHEREAVIEAAVEASQEALEASVTADEAASLSAGAAEAAGEAREAASEATAIASEAATRAADADERIERLLQIAETQREEMAAIRAAIIENRREREEAAENDVSEVPVHESAGTGTENRDSGHDTGSSDTEGSSHQEASAYRRRIGRRR